MKKTGVCALSIFVFISLFHLSLWANNDVKIAMGYIPNVQFAPYYVAAERGFFKEEGLSVTFDYGMATDIMSLVGSGQISFGISDGEQLIVARDRGIPVKAVYSMYVKYPVAVVSFREKGIADIRALKGKRVGTPVPYGSNYFGLQVMLRSAGLSIRDIDLEFIGYTQVESLIADRIDAAVVFINNEPVVLRKMGRELNVLDTYSIIPMVSASIVTSETMIEGDPMLVRRFIRAVVKGSRYILQDSEGVVPLEGVMPLLKKYVPTLTEQNLEMNREVLLASLKLWTDSDTRQHGLGYTSESDWVLSIEEMYALGLIKNPLSAGDCYTNVFVAK
jgi:NitT/TauT family transport system substrate-binding protein